MADIVALAKGVLAADGQPFQTLSLAPGLSPVTPDTPVAEARRNYMRLAGMIHPDKAKDVFDKATEAFQCLVRAFESFADPKARKAAAAAAQPPARDKGKGSKTLKTTRGPRHDHGGTATAETKAPRTVKGKGKKAVAAEKPRRRSRKKSSESDDEDSSEDTDDDETEDESEDDEGLGAGDAEPSVSTSRTPIGPPRTGGVYTETTVGCPHCRTRWEPDAKPQYSLFMGPWGKRVHCQLCLFVFGSATALHGCPHCTAVFDYDASMYDTTVHCAKCKKEFGFPYYPVNQHLIDQIALEDWKEQRERERVKEREARMKARRGGKEPDDDEEQLALLVGTCIMSEQCPLCNRRIKSQHRAHVQECRRLTPEARKSGDGGATAKAARRPSSSSSKQAAAAKPPSGPRSRKAAVAEVASAPRANNAAPAAVAKPKGPAPQTAGKRAPAAAPPRPKKRRRADSSEDESGSEEETVSDSESEEEEFLSDESDGDDDDDDDSEDE